MRERQQRWDARFMELARLVSTWSKDPSTVVGAVIVDANRRILSTGYNGFPEGIDDSPEKYEDREHKYAHVVHAELNAILDAGGRNIPQGSTLYLWGLPGPPCSGCAKHVIQTGIVRVVSRSGPYAARWAKEFEQARAMLDEVGVEYEEL
jgi:dCMP deaminase